MSAHGNAHEGARVLCADAAVRAVQRIGTIATIVLETPQDFVVAGAGQFALLQAPGSQRLPRPLSIVDGRDGLHFAFNILGPGTRALAECAPGEPVQLIGPLGAPIARSEKPLWIITDRSHVGATLSVAIDRGRALPTRVLYVLAEPEAREDAALVARFQEAGAATQTLDIARLPDALAEAAATHERVLVGARDRVAAMAQAAFAQHAAGDATATLHAPMACGLGACHVCVRRFRDGTLMRVCDGPAFPLAAVSFDD